MMILTVESVPLIGVQTRGNLRDGEKIILVNLPLQTRFLKINVGISKDSNGTTLQKHTSYKAVMVKTVVKNNRNIYQSE